MAFKLLDSNLFPLPNSNGRFVHLASIGDDFKEYIAFVDRSTGKCYIEDITGGNLTFIEDDHLAEDLSDFLNNKSLLDPRRLFTEPVKDE